MTDPLGHTTTYDYDSLGRLITVTDALDHSIVYTYDTAGNRTSATDAEGVATCYGYDDLNRLVSVAENCVPGAPSTAITNVLTVYGYTTTFVVRTRPGNECGGAIGYWNAHDSWVSFNLELMVADEEGLCIGVRRPNWQELDAGNQIVVLAYEEGRMAALDVQEGTVRWRRGSDYIRALIIANGLFYVAAQGEVRCYDVATGEWLWDVDLPDENVWGLGTDQGRLYVLSRETWILDLTTGEIQATFNVPDSSAIMMITDGRIFAEERGQTFAYDAETRQQLWSIPYRPANPYWYPFATDGTLLFRTDTGSLVAANVETGNVIWEYRPLDAQVISNVAVLDGRVYFLASDKTLRAVDLSTGQDVGQLQSSHLRSWHDVEVGEGITVPGVAASEEMLFVSFGGRTLYAFAPKN